MGDKDGDSAVAHPPSGPARFSRALGLRRNAIAGFGLGTALAVAVFVQFAYLADRRFALAYWLALAFVLAVGTGLLLTVAFTIVAAYRLADRL